MSTFEHIIVERKDAVGIVRLRASQDHGKPGLGEAQRGDKPGGTCPGDENGR